MDDVYARLAEYLNYPNSSYLMKILQRLMTPEEGKLVAEFALAGAKTKNQCPRGCCRYKGLIMALFL